MGCFLGVWDATDGGDIIQLLVTRCIFHRQIMASSEADSATGAGKVGAGGKYIGERRGG